MAPVTELAIIPLKPGIDLASGETKALFENEILNTIKAQEGFKSLHMGLRIEDPTFAEMLIEWEDIKNHETFIANPVYGPFIEKLQTFITAPPTLFHVNLGEPIKAHPRLAPVTECLSSFLPADADTAKFDANFEKFIELGLQHAQDVTGAIAGWAVEEVGHEKLPGGGGEGSGQKGKGKLFWAAIGWPSLEAHKAFRETQAFNEVIPYIRDGPVAAEVHHVEFKAF